MARNTGIVYGPTGSYKTANLGFLAKYIFAKTKKPIRLVTADNGGYAPIQPLVDAGIIEVLSLINEPAIIFLMNRLVEGYWPKNIVNGVRQDKAMLHPDNLANISGYFFEGATSISEAVHSIYAGKQTGMKPAYTETIVSDFFVEGEKVNNRVDNVTIGGYSQDSYGLTQAIMVKAMNYSWTLPVEYVWWTGHPLLSEDDSETGSGRRIITGIQLVGKAATPRIGKNQRTMIHAYENSVDGKTEYRYWFQTHPDNNLKGITWEAKPRVPAECIPELMKMYKDGYFIPTTNEGLDKYVAIEEQLSMSTTNDVKVWKDKVLSDK